MKKIIPLLLLSLPFSSLFGQQKSPFDSLAQVLEKRFEVRFFYDVRQTNGLDIIPSTGNLEEILSKTLEGSGLGFHIDSKARVFIYRGSPLFTPLSPNFFSKTPAPDNKGRESAPEKDAPPSDDPENKIYIIGAKGGTGNSAVISGYVRDARNGEPISAASVTIEGTAAGVSTDAFGFFSITAPKGRQLMKVSSIGMKESTRQLNVQGNGKLDLEMNEEIRSLKTALIVAD